MLETFFLRTGGIDLWGAPNTDALRGLWYGRQSPNQYPVRSLYGVSQVFSASYFTVTQLDSPLGPVAVYLVTLPPADWILAGYADGSEDLCFEGNKRRRHGLGEGIKTSKRDKFPLYIPSLPLLSRSKKSPV